MNDYQARWRIQLFGGLRAECAQRVITRFRTQKTAFLFAYLALHSRRTHSREILANLLWPECDETPARQSLSVALSSLRRQLEPPGVPGGTVLIADRFSVQLNPSAITTDVALFEAELDQAPGGSSPGERSQHLSRAVELYAGEFLPGCYEDWCLTERERLFESYLRALRELIAELEGTGNLDRALQYARQAVNADPLREETQSELIRLLIAAREPAAALRQYRELERLLKRELDEAPSLSTQELLRQIERQGGPEQESEPRPSAGAQIAGPSAGGALADRTPPPASARKGVRSPLPSGTVTFLVSNLDLSPERREELGPAAEERWNACRKILREELRAQGGLELPGSDDPFAGVFGGATEALQCSLAVARRIAADNGADHLRVVLHTGEVPPGTADYADSALETATQLLWASHGGQVVCAEQTAALLRGSAHPGAEFTHLGLFHLAGARATERLFQVEHPDLPSRDCPPPNAARAHPGNLPLHYTRFVGREVELGRVGQLLLEGESRLITLTGPGGSGKTRLAVEAANRVSDAFHGGLWYVAMAEVSDLQQLLGELANVLGVTRAPGAEPLEDVVARLSLHTRHMAAESRALLLLDNFEHLLDEGAPLVRAILDRVPGVTCLITSRQAVEISGEVELPVAPLPTPDLTDDPERLMACESVMLFVDRAQAVRPDFQVTPQTAAAIGMLCSRLEGLPLALELAAQRAQVLTPAQMLEQLERRFDLLVSRRRDVPERHRTLRAALDWSYQLLSPPMQRYFAQLSVFRGAWTLEAAEQICGEPMAAEYTVELLVSSLAQTAIGKGDMRFCFLETLREYAAAQLEPEEESELRRRHARYYLELAEEAEAHLTGGHEAAGPVAEWLERLELELDNLRAALAWCRSGGEAGEDRDLCLRLAAALAPFWRLRGYFREGRAWLEEALAYSRGADRRVRARALHGCGALALVLGDHEVARERLEESVRIWRELGERRGLALALADLASVALHEGRPTLAHSALVEAGDLFSKLRDSRKVAEVRGSLAELRLGERRRRQLV